MRQFFVLTFFVPFFCFSQSMEMGNSDLLIRLKQKKEGLYLSIKNLADSSVVIGDSVYLDSLYLKKNSLKIGEYSYLDSYRTTFYKLGRNKKKCFSIDINAKLLTSDLSIEILYSFKFVNAKSNSTFKGYTNFWFPESYKMTISIIDGHAKILTERLF